MRRRQRHDMFATANSVRYIVRRDMQSDVVSSELVAPGADLRAALASAIARLESDGWMAESDAAWGFVFVRRTDQRNLLMLTERDPSDHTLQSFSPHQ